MYKFTVFLGQLFGSGCEGLENRKALSTRWDTAKAYG